MLSSNFEKPYIHGLMPVLESMFRAASFFFFVGFTVKVTGCYEHLSFAATRVQ